MKIKSVPFIRFRDKYNKRVRSLHHELEFPRFPDADPEAILITDSKGNISYVNPAWEHLTGYTFEEVKDKNPRFLDSGKTPKRVFKSMWKSLSNGKSFVTDEIRNVRKDGKEYQVLSSFFPITKKKKNIYYAQIQHDITQQRQVQDQLKEKDKILDLIINNAGAYAIFLLDKKGFVKSWHKGAERLKGYMTEEVIGRHFSIFYQQEDIKKGKPQGDLKIAAEKGKIEEVGLRVKKDGSLYWANNVITAIYGKRGGLNGFVNISRDTSEWKEVEDILRFHDQILADMAEGVMLSKTRDGKILYTNPAFNLMFGYEEGELVGQHVQILNARTIKSPKKIAEDIITQIRKNHSWSGEIFNRRKDGSTFWTQTNISTFNHHEYGEVWISVQQDITAKKENEKQKDAFIGIASHELKTPLTTLSAYTQMLESSLKEDKKNMYFLQNIKTQTDRLLSLIDELLNVSRIDSNRLVLKLKPFDIDVLVHKVAVDFQFTTHTHTIEVEGSAEKLVKGDENRIEQVLVNLITNAIKYSPGADRVIISLFQRKEHVIVSVKDFGLGIGKADLNNVFDRFYRTKDKIEGSIEGFGLGLYISKEIIKLHKGRMWAESKKNKGSTFYFTLKNVKE